MKKPAKYTGILIILFVFVAAFTAQQGFVVTESGLKYKDLKAGSGETADTGKVAVIHFRAWRDNNGEKGAKLFDTREQRGQPVAFKVGTDKVIPGWNIGVVGMKVGGKRRLMVPAALGYGERGSGEVIPPNADLIYDIELVDVK